jgi:hypothetical protein
MIGREFGLIGIDGSDPSGDRGLFLGSYSYEVYPYVSLTDSVLKKIESEKFDWSQLRQILNSPDQHATGKHTE